MFTKCRECDYVCSCCSSRTDCANCSGCENHHDEFKPAENIIYCPLTGEKVEES